MTRPTPHPRAAYCAFHPIQTRWADNDVYGHVNNVTYYSYFDTAVNAHLIAQGALNIEKGHVIGLVVETGCHFFAPAAYPDALEVGFRVSKLGRSSVRYELGVFRQGEETACAQGHFIHVYVDRETRRPTDLPARFREVLEALLVTD